MTTVDRLGRNAPKHWPDDKIARLTELWQQGFSCSWIAKMLKDEGWPLTRNAVIGKAHRLKLLHGPRQSTPAHTRTDGNTPAKPRPPRRPRTKQTQPLNPQTVTNIRAFVPLTDAASDLTIPIEQRKTFIQLQNHNCHWPVGDPKDKQSFFFCGSPEADLARNIPYCRAHAERAKGRRATREEIEDAVAAQRAFKDAMRRVVA